MFVHTHDTKGSLETIYKYKIMHAKISEIVEIATKEMEQLASLINTLESSSDD